MANEQCPAFQEPSATAKSGQVVPSSQQRLAASALGAQEAIHEALEKKELV